ncbi:MAG: hypothetical protein Q4A82_01420 [Corynebacterium sp.]|nr:hypothetical protein [Corynebacterium sp.]
MRVTPIIALITIITLALSGCSQSSENALTPAGNGAVITKQGDFQPATIEHKFGETTITKRSERVVTMGNEALYAALALGVAPIQM